MKRFDANDIWEDVDGDYIKYDDHLFELSLALEPKVCKWEVKGTDMGGAKFGQNPHTIDFHVIAITKFCQFCGGRIEVVE